MTAILFSLVAFASTFLGGLFALKHRDRLHYILSFTAGVVMGVVCFDLLPEIFELSEKAKTDPLHAMVALVIGFLFFHLLEKLFCVHHAHGACGGGHKSPQMGVLSALALIAHSFMDGAGIGLAFQASTEVGLAVALAVIAHDFCDGLNTVGLMMASGNTRRKTLTMLAASAAAPVLGAISATAIALPPSALVSFLGFFAGFLLYIGAAEVLPEAHSHATPALSLRLVALTATGAAVMYAVVRVAA